jgi:hypothetical protein
LIAGAVSKENLMKKQKQIIMTSLVVIAMLVVGFGMAWVLSAFGGLTGNVYPVTNFDAGAKAVLIKSLRINASEEIQFKHASLLYGKDSTLYVCFEASQAKWESLLESASFATLAGQVEDVPFDIPGMPWWKIEMEKVDSIVRATEGYTVIIALKDESGVRRVFICTDGGQSSFPKDLYDLLKNQQ